MSLEGSDIQTFSIKMYKNNSNLNYKYSSYEFKTYSGHYSLKQLKILLYYASIVIFPYTKLLNIGKRKKSLLVFIYLIAILFCQNIIFLYCRTMPSLLKRWKYDFFSIIKLFSKKFQNIKTLHRQFWQQRNCENPRVSIIHISHVLFVANKKLRILCQNKYNI